MLVPRFGDRVHIGAPQRIPIVRIVGAEQLDKRPSPKTVYGTTNTGGCHAWYMFDYHSVNQSATIDMAKQLNDSARIGGMPIIKSTPSIAPTPSIALTKPEITPRVFFENLDLESTVCTLSLSDIT